MLFRVVLALSLLCAFACADQPPTFPAAATPNVSSLKPEEPAAPQMEPAQMLQQQMQLLMSNPVIKENMDKAFGMLQQFQAGMQQQQQQQPASQHGSRPSAPLFPAAPMAPAKPNSEMMLPMIMLIMMMGGGGQMMMPLLLMMMMMGAV